MQDRQQLLTQSVDFRVGDGQQDQIIPGEGYEGQRREELFQFPGLEGIDDDIGLDEYIYGDGVCVIEWGKFIENIIPSDSLTMDIRRVDENVREVTLSGNESLIKDVIEAWQEC